MLQSDGEEVNKNYRFKYKIISFMTLLTAMDYKYLISNNKRIKLPPR